MPNLHAWYGSTHFCQGCHQPTFASSSTKSGKPASQQHAYFTKRPMHMMSQPWDEVKSHELFVLLPESHPNWVLSAIGHKQAENSGNANKLVSLLGVPENPREILWTVHTPRNLVRKIHYKKIRYTGIYMYHSARLLSWDSGVEQSEVSSCLRSTQTGTVRLVSTFITMYSSTQLANSAKCWSVAEVRQLARCRLRYTTQLKSKMKARLPIKSNMRTWSRALYTFHFVSTVMA